MFLIDFIVVLMAITEFEIEIDLYHILAVILQSFDFNYFIQGFRRKIAIIAKRLIIWF